MSTTQGIAFRDGPPMIEVKNIFFKALCTVNYYAEEAEADAVDNQEALAHFYRALECSNKYGCLFLSYNNSFFIIRVKDILTISNDPNVDSVTFDELKKLNITSAALPTAPNIISLSNGEEYLAVDTVRDDCAWVVVFKLSDFMTQKGTCAPLCEIRCSSSCNTRIRSLNWNPGENMNNLIAINVEDGALFLAKILGPNKVELNRFPSGDVRSLCWSPKGKQLVIGKVNGNINQLKLDWTVAKEVPRPDPNDVPISILWTQTTQFLIVFQNESKIDFMQLDLPKGAQPIYSDSGDIFLSDIIPDKSSCFFLSFMPWDTVMAMTNTASDVVVLVKESQNNAGDFWIPGDVADNRRAAFQLDHVARGATVYYGSQDPVIFSEAETYPPMPVVFLLSQRGALSVFSIVNSNREAQSLKVDTIAPLPDTFFELTKAPDPSTQPFTSSLPQNMSKTIQPVAQSPKQAEISVPRTPGTQQHLLPQQPAAPFSFAVPTQQPQPQPTLFKLPQQSSSETDPFSQNQGQTVVAPSSQAATPANLIKSQKTPSIPSQAQGIKTQQQHVVQKLGGFVQQLPTDPRQLGSSLPSAKDMAGLQKVVEEKRREMTTHLQKGGSDLKGLEEDDHCAFVVSEVRKFEHRLTDFVAKMDSTRINLSGVLNTSFNTLEKSVLSTLNVVEDFSSDIEATTKAQKEEVDILKERILNHFSQLEYAKSLVERSRDPRYLEHLRSKPLDPATQQKFDNVSKLHNYITGQIAQCRGSFYEQSRKRDAQFDRVSLSQLIYLTLSNHSKIIRRLNNELDNIKERLGLGKHTNVFDDAEYLTVCDPCYVSNKKDAGLNGSVSQSDEITLKDLTAGISRVKLNKDSDRPDRKPIKLSNRKLLFIKKSMATASVTKLKIDEAPWTRTLKSTHPKPLKSHPLPPGNTLSRTLQSNEANSETPFISSSIPSKGVSSVGSSNEPLCLTPDNSRHASFGSSSAYPAMAKPSMISFGNTFSALASSSAQSDKPTENPPVIASSKSEAFTSSTSLLKTSFSTPVPSQSISFGTSMPVTVSNVMSSPSLQTPTLANLLSTPPAATGGVISFNKPATPPASSTLASGGTSSSGAVFTSQPFSFSSSGSTETITTTASSSLFSSGSSAFMFGTQQQQSLGLKGASATAATLSQSTTATLSTQATPLSSAPTFTAASVDTGISGGTTKTQSTTTTSSSLFGFVVSPKTVATSMVTPTATAAVGKTSTSISFGSPAPLTAVPDSLPDLGKGLSLSTLDTSSTSSLAPATPVGGGSLFSGATVSFGSSVGVKNLFGAPSNVVVSAKSASPSTSVSNIASAPGSDQPPTASVVSSTSSGDSKTSTTSTAQQPTTAPTVGTEGLSSLLISTTSGGGLFSFAKPVASSPAVFGKGGITFGTPPASSGLFGTPPTTTSTSESVPVTITPTTTPSSQSLPAVVTTSASGIFSVATTTAPGGLFSAAVTSTSTSTSTPPQPAHTTGLFSSAPFAAPTATATTTAAPEITGFASALNLSTDSAGKTTSSAGTGLFSAAFGSTSAASPVSAASIFGGSGGGFGSQQQQTATPSGIFGSATSQGGFGAFGQAKPPTTTTTASTGLFGSPATTTTTSTSVFGGSATFGSSSPFGASFGATTGTSTFGSPAATGSIFGSTATTTNQTTSGGFGALAQQQPSTTTTTTTAFGSPFGGGGSLFGSPAASQPKPGLFSSSTFGSPAPAATSAGSIFGGSAVFGQNATSPGSGAFSSGTAGVAQQGFGFGQSKPSTGIGSPAAATASPVFGGAATFGSTSPFGSSFTASPGSNFGSGTSVFGGAAATSPTTGFGALAQQSSAAPTGFASAGFGAVAASPPAQQFGSPTQQQAKPVFGGQAFSSWR